MLEKEAQELYDKAADRSEQLHAIALSNAISLKRIADTVEYLGMTSSEQFAEFVVDVTKRVQREIP